MSQHTRFVDDLSGLLVDFAELHRVYSLAPAFDNVRAPAALPWPALPCSALPCPALPYPTLPCVALASPASWAAGLERAVRLAFRLKTTPSPRYTS